MTREQQICVLPNRARWLRDQWQPFLKHLRLPGFRKHFALTIRSSTRYWSGQLDGIDRFAVALFLSGLLVLSWGLWLDLPASFEDAVRVEFGNWAPNLIVDGLLLWVVNGILKRQERQRTLAQIGSLSNEFALDAVRRAREDGWLADGSLRHRNLSKAALARADLTDADLRGAMLASTDLSDACLQHADLRNANLEGANFRNADLRWCRMNHANLRWADLRGAWLEGAWLEGVDGRFASVDAHHAEAGLLDGCIHDGYLHEKQIRQIRSTLDQLLTLGTVPVGSFYARLFELAPDVRPLFTGDMTSQARKFMQSLKVIVAGLEAPEKHVTVLQRLGARHASYGVQARHYEVVEAALIGMLEDTLDAAFSDEVRLAWQSAYRLIAAAMMDGATREAAAVQPQ